MRFWLGMSAGLALTVGCASPSGPEVAETASSAPAPSYELEPSADYQFLVARQLELEGRLPEALDAYRRAAALDPGSADLQRKVAELAARQGALTDAVEHAERAYALDPDDEEVRVLLGTLYRLQRDPRAVGVLTDAEGQPVSADAAFLLYSIHLEADELPEALASAEWIVERHPESVRGHLALASVYEKMDRVDDFEASLRSALERKPGNLAIYGALARSRRARGDRVGEIAIYQEILVIYPHHHATLVSLADALVAQNRLDEASDVLHEIETFYPEDTRSLLRLALLDYEAGRYESAETRLETALAAEPEEYGIAYFLGLVRQRTGEEDAALAAFSRVPPEHPRYPDARTQMATIYERRGDFAAALAEIELARSVKSTRALDLYRASLQAKAGDFEGAVAFLQGLLEDSPDDDELLYNLGVLYGENERYDEALAYMLRAHELQPDNPAALNYIGYTWTERGENLDEAEAMITRALELRPDDGYITDSLGWVYYMRARLLLEEEPPDRAAATQMAQEALRQLKRARELTGGDPVISEHIGDVYLLLDNKPSALESYEDALDREPREQEQPNLRNKTERLRRELGTR